MEPDGLVTEAPSAEARDLDRLPTRELVAVMNRLDAAVPAAVGDAGEALAAAIDRIVEQLRGGGRLIYVGAGSSGLQAAADAAECEATFSTLPGQVVAVVAEDPAAEDDAQSGAHALRELGASAADAVVGVSASGRTPYVVAALEAAAAAGAFTAAVVSAPRSRLAEVVDREIAVHVGPEVIAGSTRLKAGTAQKLVLNTISTVSMIRLGKVYDNLMVDVSAANEKLRERARRIVEGIAGVGPEEAAAALAAAGGNAKVAVLTLLEGVAADEAGRRLEAAGGDLRAALDGRERQ